MQVSAAMCKIVRAACLSQAHGNRAAQTLSEAANRYINLERDKKFPSGDNKMYMLLDQLQRRVMK